MFRRIVVCGAGTMGNGIAQVFAHHGCEVTLVDAFPEALERGLAVIEKNLGRMATKDLVAVADIPKILGRIRPTESLEEAAQGELVVEAVPEDFEVKRAILEKLDGLVPAETILASNTSSISITRLAALTGRPERVIGMHFMNPVPVMKLVEVIRGRKTGDGVCATVMETARALGKTPVEVRDSPGFISNRLLMPMINEACYALMEGVAAREAIDTVMKLGMAHPMGPLTLADLIGLDTCLSIMEVLYEGFGDPKYRPCPLLRNMVAAGDLGRKTGRGFYDYTGKA